MWLAGFKKGGYVILYMIYIRSQYLGTVWLILTTLVQQIYYLWREEVCGTGITGSKIC
jgi:hypothetical protein